MRQALGPKKVARLRRETGLPIVHVLVRGGTDHRRDLCLIDNTIACMWPDGSITKDEYDMKWRSPMAVIEFGASDAYYTTDWQADSPVPEWGQSYRVLKDRWDENPDGTITRTILEAEIVP